MQIRIHFTLTPDDLLDFKNPLPDIPDHFKSRGNASRLQHAAGWLLLLGAAILILTLFKASPPAGAEIPPRRWTSYLIEGGLAGVMLFSMVAIFLRRHRLMRQARQAVHQAFADSPDLSKPQTVTVTEDAIHQETAASQTTLSWRDATQLVETPRTLFLYFGKEAVLTLPRRGFASAADIDAFLALARARVDVRPLGFPVQPARSSREN